MPPYLLEAIAARASGPVADVARQTLRTDGEFRARRPARPVPAPPGVEPATEPGPRRTIFDAGGHRDLPGEVVRAEGDAATGDLAVDEAYEGLGATWRCYFAEYDRDSIDDGGLPLLATVHYGEAYDNAFWDGTRMVFGDGDGEIFRRFTASLDVIGHELTHGVIDYSARLLYEGQSGALNESVADVFGSLVRQRALGQTAGEADWLIGADLLTDNVHGRALRSLEAPGTAYDDPVLGEDPQPAHMDGFVVTDQDNGGVHINSGIPNHAFYLAATALGGHAWERAGQVWYDTITGPIEPDCDFATFAGLTVVAARARYAAGSPEVQAVTSAWEEVGVEPGVPVSEPLAEVPAQVPAEVPPDPDSWIPLLEPPPLDALLRVARSGGFAGLVRERSVVLTELPESDAREWQVVLASRELRVLADGATVGPDAFTYHLACAAADVDLTLAEPDLPQSVLRLIERTLAP